MADYSPKKAALYNSLIQKGMSQDAAFAQSGISEAESTNYAIGDNGQLGSTMAGGGSKVAGVDYDPPTKAEAAESAKADQADAADSARFDQGLKSPSNFEQVDYAQDAAAQPSSKTPINYTTTSTETVSGGGSTTVTAGARTPNAASEAVQPQIAAKQAEIDQFQKDNPSDFARKKQGLPPLSPEEKQERQEKLDKLSAERGELKNKQIDAETPGTPTVTTVPNTTTTTETVTSGTTSTNEAVDSNNDQQQAQQTEAQIDAQGRAPNADTAAAPAPVAPEELGNEYGFTSEEDEDATIPLGEPAPVVLSDEEILARQNAGGLSDEEIIARQSPAPVAPSQNPGGLSDEEILARQNARGLSDEEILAREATAQAAQQAATLDKARAQNTIANQRSNKNNADWRVKLRLAPLADYLYMAKPPGILAPLAPDGVIFPYTPSIQTSYKANYATTDITHSNYKGYFYQGSAVEPFTLSSTFTAQSTAEAEYLLAVIHFFRSVTKMFYGQDPQRGTPPPLVYLTGLGEFQFNEHPCVVSGFTYDLPADVDYIRAYSPNVNNSNMLQQRQSNNSTGPGTSWGNGILGGVLGGAVNRLATSKLFNGQPLPKGGQNIPPPPPTLASNTIPTYVPTKMTIAVSLLPVVSRQAQSQRFSVRQYATGDLQKGGMW